MPVRTLRRQDHHANDTAGAAIPPNSLLERPFDEINCLLLLHTLLPICVAVAVNVGRSGSSNRIGLLVQRAAKGNAVDLASVTLVPARNNQTGPACNENVSVFWFNKRSLPPEEVTE